MCLLTRAYACIGNLVSQSCEEFIKFLSNCCGSWRLASWQHKRLLCIWLQTFPPGYLCHHVLINLMLFQTCMASFLLHNTKGNGCNIQGAFCPYSECERLEHSANNLFLYSTEKKKSIGLKLYECE